MHKANLIGVGSPRTLLGSLCPKGTRRYPVAIAFNASGEGRIWMNCDALGLALAVLTWTLLCFTDWVVVRYVLYAWFSTSRPRFSLVPLTDLGSALLVMYQLLLGLSWFSHFRAVTTDPGTIPVSAAPPDFANPRVCKLCQGRWKPPRAHHCKTCKRCIFRMDHHCPWINNCVGLSNQKLFILFLVYTCASAVFTLVLLAGSAFYWLWSQKNWSDAPPPGSASLICTGMVAVECFAAVLFVSDFLQEQVESIQMNSTLVETYQRTHGARSTFYNHFVAVFGASWWTWPLPYSSAPPPDYTEPAIADDPYGELSQEDTSVMDDNTSLGIAGEESEEAAMGSEPPFAPFPPAADGPRGIATPPRQRNRIDRGAAADDHVTSEGHLQNVASGSGIHKWAFQSSLRGDLILGASQGVGTMACPVSPHTEPMQQPDLQGVVLEASSPRFVPPFRAMKRAADGFPPGMPPGKMAVPQGADALQTLWKAAAALASLPGMPPIPGMPGMPPPFKPAPAAPAGPGDTPKVAPGSVVPPKAPKAMGGLLLPDVSGNGAMPSELPMSVPPWKLSSPPPKAAPALIAKQGPPAQAETSPEVAPCKSQMAPNDLMAKQQTMPGMQALPWKAPAATSSPGPPSGSAGFSKAAAAASAMGQASASPTELLRRGEELLRQTAQLHQQNELAQKQQEEERRRQEEKEQARQKFEELRRQQEEERKRLKEEADHAAQSLQDELRKLIEVAELEVQMAEAEAQKIDEPKQCEELLRVAEDFEVVSLSAATAVKACFEFMDGKHMKLKGNTEATMSNCASLLKRSHAAKAGSERATAKVRLKAKPAREEITAKSLQAELDTLLAAAEIEVEQVKSAQAGVLKAQTAAEAEAKATPEGGGGALDKELIRLATELERSSEEASKSVAGCMARMDGATNMMRIRGPTEELKASAGVLQNRARTVKSSLEEMLQKARAAKAMAAQRVEREVRKAEALKEAARQEAIFKQYDKDSDGLLDESEIRAYIAGEYTFELAEEKLTQILSASSDGVSNADFAKLRSQINDAWNEVLNKQRKEKNDKQMAMIKRNSAEILSALSGVESEVAKAEAQVRILGPMVTRGVTMMDMLGERTEAAESAVDAARDFLAAAKEQALALGVDSNFETEAKQMAAVEARNLQMKVTALENRVNTAAHVSKAARSKIQLQERKAALLREGKAVPVSSDDVNVRVQVVMASQGAFGGAPRRKEMTGARDNALLTSPTARREGLNSALHILAQENMAPVSKPSSSSAQTFQGEAKSNSTRVCLAWILACLLLLAAGWSFSSECVDSEDGPGSATAEAAMVALVFGLAAAVGRFSKPAPPLTI
ncbi:Zdhhc3 [Symbiodinium sp. KB8]|nr:Zdhhc3 [Symbiodinium sp. KB8]